MRGRHDPRQEPPTLREPRDHHTGSHTLPEPRRENHPESSPDVPGKRGAPARLLGVDPRETGTSSQLHTSQAAMKSALILGVTGSLR